MTVNFDNYKQEFHVDIYFVIETYVRKICSVS